jgi:hypothetical protein
MNVPNLSKYIEWLENGVSFSVIREDLLTQGVPSEKIKALLEELDQQTWLHKQEKINKSQGWQRIIAGTILTISSLLLFMIGSLP